MFSYSKCYMSIHMFFKKIMPRDSRLRPLAKVIGADLRTLSRALVPWEQFEKKPMNLVIEPTNICNSNCIFCAYQFQSRLRNNSGLMPPELYRQVVSEYERLGGYKWLYICPLVGESLLDPDIVNKIVYAKQRGFFVTIFTNGIMLNKIDVEGLVNSGVDEIIVSTAPFDENSHRLLCRSNSYKDVLEGTVKLLKKRNHLNSKCLISIAVRAHIPYRDIIRMPDFINFILPLLRDNEVKVAYESSRIKDFDNWGGQIYKKDLIGIMDFAKSPRFKFRPCIRTFSVVVLFDGTVRGCGCRFADTDHDELYIGDSKKDSLRKIWHGGPLKDLRRRFVRGRLPKVCRSCTMYLAS